MKQLQRHNFTLLEILVAVAVLVIMMGFLFQFVISAQRVWAASEARSYMADQANAVFQMMAEDFSQMIAVSDAEDPDAVLGWHCDPDPKNGDVNALGQFERLCFFATDRDEENGAIYSVMYYYKKYDSSEAEGTTGKLYRIRTTDPVWEKVGDTDTPADPENDFGLSSSTVSDDDYLLAENVTEFKVQAAGNTDTTELPRFFRVTMTVRIPTALSNGTANDGSVMNRTFSRVFFIDSGE